MVGTSNQSVPESWPLIFWTWIGHVISKSRLHPPGTPWFRQRDDHGPLPSHAGHTGPLAEGKTEMEGRHWIEMEAALRGFIMPICATHGVFEVFSKIKHG